MRCQFVLDEPTNEMLDDLAAARAGNRSYVVREAIQLYASLEDKLAEIESTPAFQRMMARTEADIRDRRVLSHADVKTRLHKRRRSR